MKKYIIIIILSFSIFQYSYAQLQMFAEFDDSFIQNAKSDNINVSSFNYGNSIKKGNYELDIYVNDKYRGYDIVFIKEDSSSNNVTGQLCVNEKLIDFFDLKKNIPLSKKCTFLSEISQYANAEIDLATLKLNISLPQSFVNTRPDDYVSPLLWDDGISAGFLSYDYLNYNYHKNNYNLNNQYLSLNGGVNINGWSVRHRGSYTRDSNQHSKYSSFNNYVEHDIDSINGRITIGDFITNSNVVNNFSMRGIQIAKVGQMTPQSQRGFVPDIRGVANTNARIQIKQKNQIIYETVVSPGPFNISDLYSTPYNGDLEVSILESNGTVNKFIVPFSSSSNMLRPGNIEYQFAIGEYKSDYSDSDYISNISYQYGLNNILTINSGAIIASKYKSIFIGEGLNLPIGSLSSDVILARADINNKKRNGYSLHADYSISFNKTNTYLSFAAFRFSSKDYFSLDETMNYKNRNNEFYSYNRMGAKSQYQINLSQTLPNSLGSFYINAYQYSYWNRDNKSSYIQFSYNNSFRLINYSFGFYTNINNTYGQHDKTQLFASVSIPFNFMKNAPRLYSTINASKHDYNNTSTISNSFGDNNEFSYSISNSNSKNSNSTYSASAGYNSPFANLTSSISTDSHGNNQYSVGISGGIVAHPYGITLANSLGDSFAIIHAKQGYGAKVNNSSNNTLDWFGNGIYNYLTPYTFNQVGVNINDVSPDVQFNSTQKRVIPRINSILLVNFETEYGPSTLINLTKSNGDPVPMGASVLFNDENIGMVAQDGQIYLKNIPDNSIINVNWGNNSCYFIYNSPLETKKNLAGFYILNEVCKD